MDILLKKFQGLENEVKDLKGELTACRQEEKNSKGKLSKLEQTRGELAVWKQELFGCRQELIDNRAKLNTLEETLQDMSELKDEVSACRRELQLAVQDNRSKMATMEENAKEMSQLRSELSVCQRELKDSRAKFNTMEEMFLSCQMKMIELENAGTTAQSDSCAKCKCPKVGKKVTTIEQKVNLLIKQYDDLSQETTRLTTLQQVLNISIRETLKRQQATQSDQAKQTLDTWQDQVVGATDITEDGLGGVNDVFSAKLFTKNPLETGVSTRLDSSTLFYVSSPTFDEKSFVFKPIHGGIYAFYVDVLQVGEGSLEIFLRGSFRFDYAGMTNTTTDRDRTSRVVIWPVKEGKECWIEVKALKGNPKAHCFFSGFLLSRRQL